MVVKRHKKDWQYFYFYFLELQAEVKSIHFVAILLIEHAWAYFIGCQTET